MSADGKIADGARSPARFGSERDRLHLEARLAEADGVLSGASTVRVYGTILPIRTPGLIKARCDRQQPPQPTYIVCSRSGNLDSSLRFFQQAVPRWLLTTKTGGTHWQDADDQDAKDTEKFQQILTVPEQGEGLDWAIALPLLYELGIHRLVVAGGGQVVASLLAVGAIDDLWLTVCPLLLGGAHAPTPVDGAGFLANVAPHLHLQSIEAIEHEVFLHYQVKAPAEPKDHVRNKTRKF